MAFALFGFCRWENGNGENSHQFETTTKKKYHQSKKRNAKVCARAIASSIRMRGLGNENEFDKIALVGCLQTRITNTHTVLHLTLSNQNETKHGASVHSPKRHWMPEWASVRPYDPFQEPIWPLSSSSTRRKRRRRSYDRWPAGTLLYVLSPKLIALMKFNTKILGNWIVCFEEKHRYSSQIDVQTHTHKSKTDVYAFGWQFFD